MLKLNRVSSRKAIQKLKRAGFEEIHFRGSHLLMKNKERSVVIPFHGSRDIAIGTLYNIIKQAGFSIDEFNKL